MAIIFDNYEEYEDIEDMEEFHYPEVVMPDEETIEEANEIKAEGCLSKTSKFFDVAFKLASIICLLSALYMQSLYAPRDREMNMDNLFSTNAVIVSQADAESICCNIEDKFGIELDDENTNSLLLNAVLCNENLTDEEKEFCCKYLSLFNDNPYLDKEKVYHSLLNVDISYKNRPYIYEDSVEGVYIDKFKSIGIFVKDEDNNVLAHELIHCICANDGNLPRFFVEGMTELLTNEYFSDNPFVELNNYPFEIYAVKMLCDATSSDVCLKAFTTGDMTPIYESLASYYGDIDMAKRALGIFDELFLSLNGDKDDISFTGEDLNNELFLYLHEVVYAKYGELTEENNFERSSFFYNEIMLLNVLEEEPIISLLENLEEFGVYCRVYFSSELKEKYSEPTIALLEDATVINEKDFQKVKIS